jgi:hypothetical protein
MALITKTGRALVADLNKAGMDLWSYQNPDAFADVAVAVSLIARHAKTYRRIAEIQCGDGIHSGEWVNAHWDWITKREDQVVNRLRTLAKCLPSNVEFRIDGDPRGWLTRFVVTDDLGIPRTVGVD